MAFLTYDINPTLQLLAQGTPSPVAAIGGAVQQYAQGKQQQQEFQLRQQLGEIQKDTAKLQQLNARSGTEAELANDMLNMYKNPVQFQGQYSEYRQKMIAKDPIYGQFLPETPPSMEQLKAMQQRSQTFQYWSEQQLRQQQIDLMKQQAKEKAAQGEKPDIQKQHLTEKNTQNFLQQSVPNYGDLSREEQTRVTTATQDLVNQYMSHVRGGNVEDALVWAKEQIANSNALVTTPGKIWGTNSTWDQNAWEEYRKSLQMPTAPETPTPTTGGTGTPTTQPQADITGLPTPGQ